MMDPGDILANRSSLGAEDNDLLDYPFDAPPLTSPDNQSEADHIGSYQHMHSTIAENVIAMDSRQNPSRSLSPDGNATCFPAGNHSSGLRQSENNNCVVAPDMYLPTSPAVSTRSPVSYNPTSDIYTVPEMQRIHYPNLNYDSGASSFHPVSTCNSEIPTKTPFYPSYSSANYISAGHGNDMESSNTDMTASSSSYFCDTRDQGLNFQ